jgi:hypothetical protein
MFVTGRQEQSSKQRQTNSATLHPSNHALIAHPDSILTMAISASVLSEKRARACTIIATGNMNAGVSASKHRRPKALNLYKQPQSAQANQTFTKTPLIAPEQDQVSAWRQSATTIEQCKTRFIRAVPLGGTVKCCQIDRSAILDLCNEALQKVHSPHHAQILSEVITKALVILKKQKARPNDPVFATAGAHLSPLDPRFAEPRLDYCANKKKRYSGDAYARRAAWRVRKWRAHGWPMVYPRQAVEEERRIDLKRAGSKKLLALDRDLSWGQEVDP